MNWNKIKTAFRSLAIRNVATTSGKQQILSGVGKCIGSQNDCKISLQAQDSTERNKGATENSFVHKRDDPCSGFETTTIFDLFDKIFVDGLFFNYHVDLEAERKNLEESLDLDFSVTFVPTKSESLESIDEVDFFNTFAFVFVSLASRRSSLGSLGGSFRWLSWLVRRLRPPGARV